MALDFSKRWKAERSKQLATEPRSDEPETAAFYTAAAGWHYDKYYSQGVWLKRLVIVNVLQFILLMLALISLAALIPLKQRVPYLYAFDTATGEVTQLGALEPSKFTADWQMTRYLLIQYVRYRESYDQDHLEYPYQRAWAMSDETVRLQYDHEVDSRTPTSPYQRYGKDHVVTVHVLSVAQLNPYTASVRFKKVLQDRPFTRRQISYQEAIIKWQYTQPELTQTMLDRDPLGFKVTYYRTSPVELETTG